MATFVLVDAIAYVHGFDYSGFSNKVTLKLKVDVQDSTTFGGSGFRSKKGGLRSVDMDLEGYFDSMADAQGFTDLGVADRAVTVASTGTAASVAYLFQAEQVAYEPFGKVGEMTPFSVQTMNTDTVGMVRGQVAAVKGNVSATGQLGSIIELPAGAAGKFVYSTFHVFSAGTTITVQVQSAPTVGFASPSTRATIGPLTTVGGTWIPRVDASGITDTFWRFNVSAITGTFNVSGAIAVQ